VCDFIGREEDMRIFSILKVFVLLFTLSACLCPPVPATEMHSEFSCSNKDATTTYYSYLRESKLQDSGYSRGMKTGSFNYFKSGDVVLKDDLRYYDGLVDPRHPVGTDRNSTLDHSLDVDFVGENGISEYYAKGFFPSNRAVSAFKKIWYIDESNKNWKLGGIYNSNRINVEAKATMGANRPNSFDFKYHARVNNGILEAKDATGWTNKTGARRLDWEQEALMKGKVLDVTNNLVLAKGRVSGAQPDDWMPCLFCSLVPPIEPTDSEWPSSNVKTLLIDGQTCRSGNCGPKSPCEEEENAMQNKSNASAVLENWIKDANVVYIDVNSRFYYPPEGNVAKYLITAENKYSSKLYKVVIIAKLATGLKFIDSTERPQETPNPQDDPQILRWTSDELDPGPNNSFSVTLSVDTAGRNEILDLEKTTVNAAASTDGNKENIKSTESVLSSVLEEAA
jgi:hypothetical protein